MAVSQRVRTGVPDKVMLLKYWAWYWPTGHVAWDEAEKLAVRVALEGGAVTSCVCAPPSDHDWKV